MNIPETIERWAARTRKPLKERIAALTQERDGIHAILIDVVRERDQLRAEVERLGAVITDDETEYVRKMTDCHSYYRVKAALNFIIDARRKP